MNYRMKSLCSALALLAAACGGTDTNNGDGGGGSGSNCQAVGCGDGGGGTNSGTTTSDTGGTGGSDVCNPTPENGNCASASSCECLPTFTTDDSWCDAGESISVYICPDTGNVCTPGHNQCGYDLPAGVDYEAADEMCKGFVNGDVWAGNDVQSGFGSDVDENG